MWFWLNHWSNFSVQDALLIFLVYQTEICLTYAIHCCYKLSTVIWLCGCTYSIIGCVACLSVRISVAFVYLRYSRFILCLTWMQAITSPVIHSTPLDFTDRLETGQCLFTTGMTTLCILSNSLLLSSYLSMTFHGRQSLSFFIKTRLDGSLVCHLIIPH